MNNRAYSVLEIRAVDAAARTIRGVATTPSVDRMGDIIDPMGMKFSNPMPLLWQHDSRAPIGTVVFDAPNANGITFTAKLPAVPEQGALRERIEEAWQSMTLGLVRAVSIGFRPIEYAFMETGGVHFTETECLELSAVTIPANADAVITTIKSIDRQLRQAAGLPDPEIPSNPKAPAAIGTPARVVRLNDPARDRAEPFIIRSIKRI